MSILTSSSAGVTTITLNRPEKLNAFAGAMRGELIAALEEAASDGQARVVVITGAGRGFCAGGDVEAMRAMQERRATDDFLQLLEAGGRIVTTIRSIDKPVIAAVNGVAAGAGCNLALACDYRIAASSARLGQTFVRIGLHPDWGGSWFLPRLVGTSRAMELMMTGRMVEAGEALQIGMVDRVVEDEELASAVEKLTRHLAAAPPAILRAIKRSLAHSPTHTLAEQCELEAQIQREAFLSSDAAEGMAAFFEKRKPEFTGS
jgi:2-(1,2-epoxy-1,2-dihydrophenyl)acetyl-CoA isomerase